MENFRAKQYENFNFEGKVGPFQTDDEIELLDEIKQLQNEIEQLKEENRNLKEENEKLKSDLAFERSMLDNVKAEYESSQNVIKKLKEELDRLEFEEGLYD